MKWQTEFYILGVAVVGCTAALSLPPSKQCCLRSSLVRNSLRPSQARSTSKVYLANELAVVRETLPAPGGQRETSCPWRPGGHLLSEPKRMDYDQSWTFPHQAHNQVCAEWCSDAEVARVRTRFRRFVLRVYVCVVHSCVTS